MSDVNIKEVEGGEVTTVGDNDGVEIDTGTVSVWIKIVNLATQILSRIAAAASDVNTGTSTVKAVTPDALAGSNLGTKNIYLPIADPATTPSTGDGKASIVVPAELNGMNIVSVHGVVTTVSSSGTPTFALRRERAGSAVDVLSTLVTIDESEKTSYDATTPPVIDTANDDLATGDILYADLDVVGTGAKGHGLIISARLP